MATTLSKAPCMDNVNPPTFAFEGIFIHPSHLLENFLDSSRLSSMSSNDFEHNVERTDLMMFGTEYMTNEDEDTEEEDEVDQDQLIKFSELALSSNVSVFSTSGSSSASTSPYWSNHSSLSTSTSSVDSSSSDYFSHIRPGSNKFTPAADVDTNLFFGEEDRSATPTNLLPNTEPISLFNSSFSFSTSISPADHLEAISPTLADQNSSFYPATPAYTSHRSLPTTRHPTRPSSPIPSLSPSTLTTTSSLMTRSYSTPVATQKTLDESRVLLGVVGSQMGARARRVLSLSSTSSPLLSGSPSGNSSTDDLDRSSTSGKGGAMERTYSNSSLGVETSISKSFRTIKSLPATPLRRPSIEAIQLDKDNALVFPYNLIARPSGKGERRAMLRTYSLAETSHYSSSKSRQSSVPALSTSAPATSNSLQYSIGSSDSDKRPTIKRRTTLLNPLTKIVAESSGENIRGRRLIRTSSS